MTNLESVKKQRHYLKVCIVKAMVFPVVMYGYEDWTVKKAITTMENRVEIP